MKPLSMYRHARAGDRITKRICGNTVAPEEPRCSTSAWVADGTDRSGFWDSSKGILQTDGYSAYDQVGGPRMVHAACWAHARRQFFEAVQLSPRDPVATPIVAPMDELFAVDAEARRRVIGLTGRHALR